MKTKKTRFPLKIVGDEADTPALLLCFGKACEGDFAYAVRPGDGRGALLHVPTAKGGRPTVWTTERGEAPTAAPSKPTTFEEGVALIKRLKELPAGAGAEPSVYRGRWSGYIDCDGGAPVVVLERNITTYGAIRLSNAPDGGWDIRVETKEGRWFTQDRKAQTDVARVAGLRSAIRAGYEMATDVVASACTLRDTTRRTAHDAAYAAEHPPKPRRPAKDPTERLVNRKPPKGASHGWTYFAYDDEAPEADEIQPSRAVLTLMGKAKLRHSPDAGTFIGVTTATFDTFPAGSLVYREAEDVGFYIRPVGPGTELRATKAAPTARVRKDIADAFGITGMPGVVTPPAELPHLAPPATPAKTIEAADKLHKAAGALVDGPGAKGAALATTLGRAAKLIQHADALVRSEFCTGTAQSEAQAALAKARTAYDRAAGAAVDAQAQRNLNEVAAQVALVAARAAKSCAAKPARAPKAPADAGKQQQLMGLFADAIKAAAAEVSAA